MAARRGISTDRVVEVAATIADAEGADAVSLARVAAELGIRTPSLYAHCAGLADLRRLLQLRALSILGARLQEAAVGRSGEEAIRAIADAYRGFARRHPGLYPFVIPSVEGASADLGEAAERVVRTVLAALAGLGLDQGDLIHAARLLRSAVHGFVHLELNGGFGMPVDIQASYDRLVDGLVDALLTPGRPG